MAFPLDCVAPLCDSFLQRAEKLLLSGDSAIFPKIRYAILTLKLLVEKNEHALHHLTLDMTQSRSVFLASAFQYMLRDMPQGKELTEMLCEFLSAIFQHISTQVQIEFKNDFSVRTVLLSLESLMAKDVLEMVPHHIVCLLMQTLLHFSSRWPLQTKEFQHMSLVVIVKLLHQKLQPFIGLFVKSVAIKLFSSLSKNMDNKILITSEEAASFSTSLNIFSLISSNEALLLLKYLVMYEKNKEILLQENVMDFLSPLVDKNSTQQNAAELLCTLMSPVNPGNYQDSLEAEEFEHDLRSYAADSQVNNIDDDDALGVLTVLISCTVKCFKSFISSCGDHFQSNASMNLMFTSTLVQMTMDVLRQEDEESQMKLANSISAIPEAPETFVHMLWGSSIIISCDLSQLPSPQWISTFFDIQNLLILCTHCGEQFSLALCNGGFVYFIKCEMEKLGKTTTNIGNGEIQKVRIFSLLTILYNCVQKAECLNLFVKTRHLTDPLASIALSPNLEIRLLSKFILGFLKLNMDLEVQRKVLKIQPDEAMYILTSLHNIFNLSNADESSYSAEELLLSILNLSDLEENFHIFYNVSLLSIFDFLLIHGKHDSLVLQIIWNLLTVTDAQNKLILIDNVSAIKTMSITSDVKALHHCVSSLIEEGKLDNDSVELLAFARCCYQYCKHRECIEVTSKLIQLLKLHECDQSMANEAKLLKAKSLFFHYQNKQHVFLQKRGEGDIKKVEKLKKECYECAKEAILLLGIALDHNFLDEEGSKLLDFAMIDYLRETNDLNYCQRCLLCRRKTKLRKSHIFPKSILKYIATDMITGEDAQGLQHHDWQDG